MKKVQLLTILIISLSPIYSQVWEEKDKFSRPDSLFEIDDFASAISMDDYHAIIGDPKDENDSTIDNPLYLSGSAYILERDYSGNWHVAQKIFASDRDAFDEFGKSVSISGNYAFVGSADASAAGACYVFEKQSNGIWQEIQKIQASDIKTGMYFGWSSVAADGDFVIIGARESNENGLTRSGSAYIFEKKPNGQWLEVKKLTPADQKSHDKFGTSVAINDHYAIVGSAYKTVYNASGDTLEDAGSAYIYERAQNGTWNEGQKITPSDLLGQDAFGWRVSISGDYTIIGAPNQDEDLGGSNFTNGVGAAYMYQRDSSGTWNLSQKLVPSERQLNSWFGWSVSIDGSQALIGAYAADQDFVLNPDYGAAYAFEKNDSGNWNEVHKIIPPRDFECSKFGDAVFISKNYVMVSAAVSITLGSSGSYEFLNKGLVYFFKSSIASNIEENNIDIKAYPNPNQGHLTLDLGQFYYDAEILILNSLGQMITSQRIVDRAEIDVEIEGPTGIYFLQVKTSTGQSALIKVMKN